ncbi:hypothetical protein TUM17563_49800 [Klebsiella oxytoca]|nr:hypothetical protein TUM17563_49800 [Klebsiella oxytoca]
MHDPADLRAHFGAKRGGGASGQAAHHRDRLAVQGNDTHFLRHLLRGSVLRIIAPAKEK